jgi:hypothetical protein
MKVLHVYNMRKDGKFKVEIIYAGEPNAFGGRYPDTRFNKLKTLEQINDFKLYRDDQFYNHSQFSDSIFTLLQGRESNDN